MSMLECAAQALPDGVLRHVYDHVPYRKKFLILWRAFVVHMQYRYIETAEMYLNYIPRNFHIWNRFQIRPEYQLDDFDFLAEDGWEDEGFEKQFVCRSHFFHRRTP